MEVLNSWLFFVVFYLVCSVTYNQCYKVTTKSMKSDAAMMVLANSLAGFFCLFLVPFFEWKFSNDIIVYLLLGLAIIFYTINDRLETTVMSGVEASTYTILSQLSTAFMIILGLVILREPFVWNKILGSALILASNVLVFYRRGKFKFDRYVILGIIANLSYAVAMFIDVNNSDKLNLPLYVFFTLFIPAIIVFLMERVKFREVKDEFIKAKKLPLFAAIVAYAGFILCSIRAYQLGEVTVVAPLISLTVILNVLVGYFFLGERDNLLKKIIASLAIIVGVILVKG